MDENFFYTTVFNIIECLTEMELRVSSKQLIINYIKEAAAATAPARAREVVLRYTQKTVPSLEEIRNKAKTQELAQLDHLVLKMEYAARQLEQQRI